MVPTVWFPRNRIVLFRHETKFRRNFAEISFCQAMFRFVSAKFRQQILRNETKFLLHVSIYTYMHICVKKPVYVNTCTSCMSILRVHAACLSFMSLLHVHAALPCCMSMPQVYAACPCYMSMPYILHVHAASHCCMSLLLVHYVCLCCMSLLHVSAPCP